MIFLAYIKKKLYFCDRILGTLCKIGCKGTTKNPNTQENREKTSIILGFANRVAHQQHGECESEQLCWSLCQCRRMVFDPDQE